MSAFMPDPDLSFEQVRSLVRAMMALADVDGVHERERGLIEAFYAECARKGDPSLDALVSDDFDASEAKTLFGTPELARFFVKNLILLAYADGTVGEEERAWIRTQADGMGLGEDELTGLYGATKDFLMEGLSHVANVEALSAVRRRLDAPDAG